MVEFFHLNPRFFPENTRDYLTLDTILKWGALPLGTKRGLWPFGGKRPRLNVGFVNPKNRAAVREVKRLVAARPDVSGVQMFRLDPVEFLEILRAAYGVDRERLLTLAEDAVEPFLLNHLQTPVENETAPAQTPN